MNDNYSKNISNAKIDAKGNVTIGDTLIFNAINVQDYFELYKSLECLTSEIEKMNDIIRKYPNEIQFPEMLQKVLNDKQNTERKIAKIEEDILEFVNEIYRIPHSKEMHQEVLGFLKKGDLNSAKNKLLKSTDTDLINKLLKNKFQAKETYLKVQKDTEEKAYECFLFAKIIILEKKDNWYLLACRLFEDSIKLYERYEYVMDYAVFLQQHNDLFKSENYYELWFSLIDHSDPNFSFNLANYLNSLGNKYSRQNNLPKAKEIHEKCLLIKFSNNGKTNKYFNKASLAISLNNYSHVLSRLGMIKEATIYGKCAYKIRKILFSKDGEKHKSCYISSLLSYGSHLAFLENLQQSKELFEEASQLLEKNFNSLNEDELDDFSLNYNNLGCTLADLGEFSDSLIYLNRGLSLRKELAIKNPQKFNQEVARTLMNIGTVYKEQKEYLIAEAYFLDSLEILNSCDETNKNAVYHYMSATIANLIRLYYEQLPNPIKIQKQLEEAHRLMFLHGYSDESLKLAIGTGVMFLKVNNISYEKFLMDFLEKYADEGKKYFV